MKNHKTLYILRHAKAETGSSTADDHERALNAQGLDACDVMGHYIAGHDIAPQLVLCSTARRAKDTWALVNKVSRIKAPQEFTGKLYLASPNEIIGQLALVPETVSHVLVVGHNPGLHQLCLLLARQGDDALIDRLHLKFPTCALATIDLGDVAWTDVGQRGGVLKQFATPKMLASV